MITRTALGDCYCIGAEPKPNPKSLLSLRSWPSERSTQAGAESRKPNHAGSGCGSFGPFWGFRGVCGRWPGVDQSPVLVLPPALQMKTT